MTCNGCGEKELRAVHSIRPHPLRGPGYESVLMSCNHCGAKRLHTRQLSDGQVPVEARI